MDSRIPLFYILGGLERRSDFPKVTQQVRVRVEIGNLDL